MTRYQLDGDTAVLLSGWQGGLLLALIVALGVVGVWAAISSVEVEDEEPPTVWTEANSINRRPGRRS